MALVLTERRADGVCLLTLNAPETHNAISDLPMVEAILDALAAADTDPGIRAIVLTGAGKSFSAGGNIKKMGPGHGLADTLPARTRLNYKQGIQRLPLAFEALETPVVAAVNGHAIGAGCDLALMCDIRIAGQSTSFAESFTRVGIVPGDGGAWLLPRVVGFARASEMALTGDAVDAQTALGYGLVSRVVPDADLLSAALGIAGRIAARPRHATRMTRRLLREAGNLTLAQTLELSAAYQALAHATADHAEALAAMLEKRQPDFTGD